jgi:hypothetical protein
MSWGYKYRVEWTDRLGAAWKVDFRKNGHEGDPTPLQAASDPLNIEWYGNDDIFEQNIMGSVASVSVISMTDFALLELFTSDRLEYLVNIKVDEVLKWYGWIMPDIYQEPYDQVPYPVTIQCTDGLGMLKDFPFSDLGYTSRQRMSQVIYDMLVLVGIGEFVDRINLYEATMGSAQANSALYQGGVDPDLFEGMTCYDVLQIILKSFNAGIKMDQGMIVIFRFPELIDGMLGMLTENHYRTFTGGETYTDGVVLVAQAISRSGSTSFLAPDGGNLMQVPAVKTLNVIQNLGNRESLLKTWQFKKEDFNLVGETFDNWTNAGGLDVSPVYAPLASGYSGLGNEGVNTFGEDEDSPGLTQYIEQSIKYINTSATDRLVVSLEYSGYYIGVSAVAKIWIEIFIDDGAATYTYLDEDTWVAPPPAVLIEVESATYGNGWSGWTQKDYLVTGIPDAGSITVRLYSAQSVAGDVYAAFKNVKLYFIDPVYSASYETIEYQKSNAIDGTVVDKEFTLGDGQGIDNDAAQYRGAINLFDTGVPIATTLAWPTDPLIETIADELIWQYQRTRQVLDIPLYETVKSSMLYLTKNLQDTYNKDGGNNRIYAISRSRLNAKERFWNLTLTEIV